VRTDLDERRPDAIGSAVSRSGGESNGPRPRGFARLAWALCTLVWLAAAASVVLGLLGGTHARADGVISLTVLICVASLGSTLAVAALFAPGRHRIPAIIDRHFYRQKHHAARTIERFGARLRDEVSLKALSDDLRGVVADTMAPAHVTLWLRAPEARR